MQRIFSFLLPSALILSSAAPLHAETVDKGAAEAGKGQEQMEDLSTPALTEPNPAPKGEGAVDAEESETEEGDDDAEYSYILRQSHKTAAEVFIDYNTFQSDKEHFTPVAYGVKAYCFHSPDLKYGVSLAMEQITFGLDKKTLASPGNFNFQNIKREGSAIRLGVHGQYFLSNSLNIEASVFGASGSMDSGDGYVEDYYSRSGLSIAFGNQWSWQKYTFGLDWLTLTYNATLRVGGENLLNEYHRTAMVE